MIINKVVYLSILEQSNEINLTSLNNSRSPITQLSDTQYCEEETSTFFGMPIELARKIINSFLPNLQYLLEHLFNFAGDKWLSLQWSNV